MVEGSFSSGTDCSTGGEAVNYYDNIKIIAYNLNIIYLDTKQQWLLVMFINRFVIALIFRYGTLIISNIRSSLPFHISC